MKLHYYPETDSLYIELRDRSGADVREVGEGIVVDVDEDGNPVGIEIDGAYHQSSESAPEGDRDGPGPPELRRSIE